MLAEVICTGWLEASMIGAVTTVPTCVEENVTDERYVKLKEYHEEMRAFTELLKARYFADEGDAP